MRIENHGSRAYGKTCPLLPRARDERLMASVLAIEMSDRQRYAASAGRHMVIAVEDNNGSLL